MRVDMDVVSSALVRSRVDKDIVDMDVRMPPKGEEMVSFPHRIRELLAIVVRMGV